MKQVICVVGPTAVGKSSLALQLAQKLHTEIISSDSRQMYREMNIGTAKPTETELEQVRHHFINTLDPHEPYNAARFEEEAEQIIHKVHQKNESVIIVGGSTLYMDALWFGFDEMPQLKPGVREAVREDFNSKGLSYLLEELEKVDQATFEQIDKKNHARVMRALEVYRSTGKPISAFRKGKKHKSSPWNWSKIGLTDDRQKLYERIDQRVMDMLEAGLQKEVQDLVDTYGPSAPGLQSIGYSEMISFLQGKIDRQECIRLIQRNSRRYAKRQLTWFRRYEDITWFTPHDSTQIHNWLTEKMKH